MTDGFIGCQTKARNIKKSFHERWPCWMFAPCGNGPILLEVTIGDLSPFKLVFCLNISRKSGNMQISRIIMSLSFPLLITRKIASYIAKQSFSHLHCMLKDGRKISPMQATLKADVNTLGWPQIAGSCQLVSVASQFPYITSPPTPYYIFRLWTPYWIKTLILRFIVTV